MECDISKYFDSVNHQILLRLIKKKIADKKVIWLIEEILNSSYEKGPGVGIPIGNLTSQLFANIYLNELDQFIKHTLRIRYYLRYMDDFLILDYNKKKLQEIKIFIQEFLGKILELELHPKKANVFPVEKGVDFLGYQIFGNYRLLRKSTVKRFIKRTKKYQKQLYHGLIFHKKIDISVRSWVAYAKHARSWMLRKRIGERLGMCLTE